MRTWGTGLLLAAWLWPAAIALAQAPLPPVPAPSQVAPPVIAPAPSVATRIALPQVQAGGDVPAAAKKLFFVLIDFDIQDEFPELVATRRELAAPLIGKRISVADVFEFANKLQQAYVRAGYPLVRVVITPQELGKDARVKMRVVDGFIERIDVSAIGAPVRERVGAVVAPLLFRRHLMQADLERWLLIAGETPGLVLNAIFTAGKEIGGSVLVLTGRYRPVSASLYMDNAMPTSFGTMQVVTSVAENGLFGLGEQFLVQFAGFPNEDFTHYYPTRRYMTAALRVPIGGNGWWLELLGTNGKTTPHVPIQQAASFGLLDQTRTRLVYEAVKRRDYELILNARYETTDERLEIIATTPPSAISLDRIRAVRTGMDGIWRIRESGTTLGFGVDYSRGLDVSGARTVQGALATGGVPLSRQGADAVFTKLNGRFEANQVLGQDVFVTFMAFGQTSFGHPLLASEQYDIVGAKMMSGLRAGQLPGDAAWAMRGELGRPFAVTLVQDKPPLLLTPYLFAATGERILELPTALEFHSTHARDLGIGTRINLAGWADFLPDSYAFVEWSSWHINLVMAPQPKDGSRFFAGMLVQY